MSTDRAAAAESWAERVRAARAQVERLRDARFRVTFHPPVTASDPAPAGGGGGVPPATSEARHPGSRTRSLLGMTSSGVETASLTDITLIPAVARVEVVGGADLRGGVALEGEQRVVARVTHQHVIAVAAEEYGLVLVLCIIALYATIVVRSLLRLVKMRPSSPITPSRPVPPEIQSQPALP